MSQSGFPESPSATTANTDLIEALKNFDAMQPGGNQPSPQVKLGVADPNEAPMGLGSESDILYQEPEPGYLARAVNRLVGRDLERDDPREYSRMGTTIAGGIGGGMAGASYTPGPPIAKALGAAAGSVAGTAVGAAAPEAVIEGLEQMGLLPAGSRERLGLNNEELWTVVSGEALLDAYTLGGVSAARSLGRGVTNMMTGANRGTRTMAETATREGISLLPVQVGEGWFARRATSVVGRFPWVAGKLKRRGERAMEQISQAFDGIPERLGPLSTFDEVSGRIMRESEAAANTMANDFNRQINGLLARADLNGVQVRPVNTRRETDRLWSMFDRAQPRGAAGERLAIPQGDRRTRDFLRKTTRLLTDIQPAGAKAGQSGTQIADQSLRQMDTLLRTIDAEIVQLAKLRDADNITRLEGLRNAIMSDMTTQVVNKSPNASPATLRVGREIVSEMRRLDQEFTEATNLVFSNPTARKVGFQPSPTGRGAILDPNRVRGADAMAEILLRSDSPEAVRDLARLVQPETMRMLASSVFSKALERAMPTVGEGARRIDVDRFAKELGLNAPNSGKAAQTRELMAQAGGITMQQLDDLIEITRRASEAELPDVSTFLARSAAFQGLRGTIRSSVPFAAVAAGGAAADGFMTGAAATALLAGGSRLLFNMISNPRSARAWRMVADQEARTGVRRAAYVRAAGFALGEMLDTGQISQEEFNHARAAIDDGMDELSKTLKIK